MSNNLLAIGDKLYKALPSYEEVICMEYTVVEIREGKDYKLYLVESKEHKNHPTVRVLIRPFTYDHDPSLIGFRYVGRSDECSESDCFHSTDDHCRYARTKWEAMIGYVNYWRDRIGKDIKKHEAAIQGLKRDMAGLDALLDSCK